MQAFILEVQRQPDKRKYYTWLSYVASLFTRLECPVLLFVICLNRQTAKWARDMCVIPGPPELMYKPSVIGPDDIPLITELEDREYFIDWLLLSLLVHSENPKVAQSLETFIRAVSQLPESQARRYIINALSFLEEGPRTILETLMEDNRVFPYGSPLLERTRAEGIADGNRNSLLKLLSSRGFTLSAGQRHAIDECTDPDQLDIWFDRALNVKTSDAVFDN